MATPPPKPVSSARRRVQRRTRNKGHQKTAWPQCTETNERECRAEQRMELPEKQSCKLGTSTKEGFNSPKNQSAPSSVPGSDAFALATNSTAPTMRGSHMHHALLASPVLADYDKEPGLFSFKGMRVQMEHNDAYRSSLRSAHRRLQSQPAGPQL